MAHYAFLNENNVVVEVIKGKDEDGTDWEEAYSQVRGLRCKRTSYNTFLGSHLTGGIPFRYTFAGIGCVYIDELDEFIPPKPFNSWILDINNKSWKAPIDYPSDGKNYDWNEENLTWIENLDDSSTQ